MEYGKCATHSTHKKIVAEENGRKFIIENKTAKIVLKVEVDGCLKIEGEKCDYLFEIINQENIEQVIYLELKGKNIEKACSQLAATIQIFKDKHKDLKKNCYIVASRVPKIDATLQNLKIEFLKKYKSTLTVKNDLHSILI